MAIENKNQLFEDSLNELAETIKKERDNELLFHLVKMSSSEKDCETLDSLKKLYGNDIEKVLEAYNDSRNTK